ncbi:MAG: hypothetical protein NC453_16145 [Muribaculum sp.]|nr:hypothetical protein [Muribaculum sp.]
MKILVESREAVLKKDFSFDYVSENRLFLGRDGYTLNIVFPMSGCPENVAIFGHIHRLDVDKKKVTFDCSIIDRGTTLNGSLSIVKVSASEIEGQFTEGRCEQTATDPFEDTYINELDLGTQPSSGSFTPADAWRGIAYGNNQVALPWINEEHPTAFNNWVVFENNTYKWKQFIYKGERPTSEYQTSLSASRLSWQPYLIVIAKRICEAIDYSYDFSEWENSDYRYLLICNTLPYTWTEGDLRKYKSIMPKWTVSEFFEKLELLLMCEFDIDHKSQSIKFSFSKDVLSKIQPVQIADVVDEYSAEISAEDESCDYIGAKRLAYKECNHAMQPFYSCDWFLANYTNIKSYANVNALIEANKRHMLTASDGKQYAAYGDGAYLWEPRRGDPSVWDATYHLMYSRNDDTYFVMRSIGVHKDATGRRAAGAQMYVLQPINVFGSGSEESDDVDTEEIEFVPVCVNDTHVSDDDDQGYMMYLSFSSYQEGTDDDATTENTSIHQPLPVSTIEAGKKETKSEYYDVIYLGFWDGAIPNYGKTPYPMIDSVNVTQDWSYFSNHLADLRLTGRTRNLQSQIPSINPKQKFKFSWLGNSIPNPRAIFYIRGKKYLCEKITATFTENGMSQLLKGEFYPLLDEN